MRVKLSDGVFENQMAMFMGTADQLPQYSVFKLTKWSVTLGAPGQPEKSLLQIEPPFEIIKKAGM